MQQNKETLPNLLVIGAQKSGTTWLHERLNAHPDIFMSATKELRFFGHREKTDFASGLTEYCSHFASSQAARYYGESTPAYFWSQDPRSPFAEDLKRSNLDIPKVVHRILGDNISLVVSLRNPVARAISAFYHHYKAGRISARDSLRSHGHRHGIIDMGFYQRHLEAWLRHFDRSRIHMILFDDILATPGSVVNDLYHFLSVSKDIHDPGLINKSNQGIQRTLKKNLFKRNSIAAGSNQHTAGPQISKEDIDYLSVLYSDDIDYLEGYLGRPLDHWRSKKLADYI